MPPEVNEAFAAAAGSGTVAFEVFEGAGTVAFEVFEGAGHLESWNVDRARYDALLSGFLAQVAPAA